MNLAHQIRNVLRHGAMHAPLKTPNTSFSLKKKQTNKTNKKNPICQDIFQGSRFSQKKKKKKKP